MLSTENLLLLLLAIIGTLIVTLVIYHIQHVNEKFLQINDSVKEVRGLFFKYIVGIDVEQINTDDIITITQKKRG
jgi:uncharacterized BrkB/YihY/UPF0761 family membrane protein